MRAEIARGNERCVGVAFDGDADRAKFVDETGARLDGDHALLILARERFERGALPGDAVVATVMSNAGLERALSSAGIGMLRAAVGDRYVLEAMRAGGYRLGGEQSGHVIDLDRNTTGDGPMTAVTLFGVAARAGARLHDLAAALTIYPQILINVRVADRSIAEAPAVLAAVAAAETRLVRHRPHLSAALRHRAAGPRDGRSGPTPGRRGGGRNGRRGHPKQCSRQASENLIFPHLAEGVRKPSHLPRVSG